MTALLSLQQGSFSYGDKEVLSGVSLDVMKGEVLCILGANGCGKTTLLRCLNGSLRLNKGHVYLGGRDIHTMSVVDVARYIGFVFQEHSAPFPFSVLEVARMGRTPYLGFFESPSAKDTLVAEQALDMVGMIHYRDKPYTQISGGERQLVLIARTLTQEPEIVLLDEPTSHLDFKNQTLVLRMINRLAESGMTVIMTSHLPNHALLYSSKVALMNMGSFMAIGSPETIVNEENLKAVYSMDVKILEVAAGDSSDTIRFCIPATSPMDVVASGLKGIINVFEGESLVKNGIAQIMINDVQFSAITRVSGHVKVHIPSEGIIISRLPFSSGGRNTLKGKVTAIKAHGDSVQLEVDIGQRLAFLLTQKSFKELGIAESDEVFITFRATAILVSPLL
jgi:iron complex transport system ATP-binding protein